MGTRVSIITLRDRRYLVIDVKIGAFVILGEPDAIFKKAFADIPFNFGAGGSESQKSITVVGNTASSGRGCGGV